METVRIPQELIASISAMISLHKKNEDGKVVVYFYSDGSLKTMVESNRGKYGTLKTSGPRNSNTQAIGGNLAERSEA